MVTPLRPFAPPKCSPEAPPAPPPPPRLGGYREPAPPSQRLAPCEERYPWHLAFCWFTMGFNVAVLLIKLIEACS